MFVEKYFALLSKDIEEARTALEGSMPDSIRSGVESELRRLQELQKVLTGETDKSQVHVLRAKLRWKRQELAAEREAAKRKILEREVAGLEADIKRLVEQKKTAAK
jgi:hypothetical protein